MDHQLIEDTALAERYVTGRLAEPERTLFEEHLVDCAICLERIEASEGFAAGLQAASALAGAPSSAPVLPRRRTHRSTWLLVGACAAGLLAAVLTNARSLRLARELASEQTAGVEARAELNAARQQLGLERSAREAAERRQATQQQRTEVRIPVLALMATRGTTAPTLELTVAPAPFVLMAEREAPPRFQSYIVTVRSTEGVALWQGRVRPSSRDAVVVALDSGNFPPGTYSLALEGEGAGGRKVPVGRYSFHTVVSASHAAAPGTDGAR